MVTTVSEVDEGFGSSTVPLELFVVEVEIMVAVVYCFKQAGIFVSIELGFPLCEVKVIWVHGRATAHVCRRGNSDKSSKISGVHGVPLGPG